MAQDYTGQKLIDIESSASSPKTLTASYVNSGTHSCRGSSQLILYVTYVPKTGESNRNLNFKVDFADDASTAIYYTQQLGETAAGGSGEKVATFFDYIYKLPGATGGTSYTKRFEIPIAEKQFRVTFKEDGSNNFGTVYVQAMVSGI